MRLFEIAPPLREVVAPSQFFSEIAAFAHKYPDLEAKLERFIQFRRAARPDQPFNDKDSPLTHMQGYRRCHLIYGKAILIYAIERDRLILLRMVEHDALEGAGKTQLRRYLMSVSPNSLQAFVMPPPMAPKPKFVALTSTQKQVILDLFKTLASHPKDRELLVAASQGDIEAFLTFARLFLEFDDTSHDKAILQALGGRDGLIRWAKRWADVGRKHQDTIKPATIEQMREHIPKALEAQQQRMFPRRIPSSEKSHAIAKFVERVPDLLGLVRNKC